MMHINELVIEARLTVTEVVIPLAVEALIKAERLDFSPITIKGLCPAGQRFSVIFAKTFGGLNSHITSAIDTFANRTNRR